MTTPAKATKTAAAKAKTPKAAAVPDPTPDPDAPDAPVDPSTLPAVPPADLVYFGRMKGQWPLHVFEAEDAFAAWLADDEHQIKCGWKATVTDIQRVGLVPPSTPAIEVVDHPSDE